MLSTPGYGRSALYHRGCPLGSGTAGAEISSEGGSVQVRLNRPSEVGHVDELVAGHHYLGSGRWSGSR
jgi:hypothetical protein